MNFLHYAALAAFAVAHVFMWVSLVNLWRAGHAQQKQLSSVIKGMEAQTQLNMMALNSELALLHKALRRIEADRSVVQREAHR